ncbi:MAG: beta strand repeat-containing protein, partial [Gammaproteobacteria bacterium]
TNNESSNAVAIIVNASCGGTGAAALRDITTGSGGTISVDTSAGTSGAITQIAGTALNVGAGIVTLTTPQSISDRIGTAASPIQITATTLNATTGNNGIFVTNSGSNALTLGTINTTGSFTLISTASSEIIQNNPMTILGTTTIAAGSGNNITLDNSANNFGTVAITSANNATLTDSNALILGTSSLSGSFNITSGGILTDSGNISVDGTLTVIAIGGITLNSAGNTINNFNPSNSGSGGITLVNTASPLTITGFTHTGGGAVTITNNGTLSVANGVTIDTGNAALTLTATDLNLNDTGALNSGSANTIITQNTASGTIGLGNTSGTMTISGSELQRITSNNLTLSAPVDGKIFVDGVSETESNNISGLTLNAISGSAGSILFQNNASSFKSLTANADDGITVGANLTTTNGNLTLNADVNGTVGTNDMLILNANLSSAGSIMLSAATGGISLAGNVNLTGNGITINDAVNGTYNLTLNAGASGNITLNADIGALNRINAFNIVNMNNLVNNGLINAMSYTQFAGNIANLGTGGLNLTGNANVAGSTFNGALNVAALTLNVNFANLSGFVDGSSGRAAIAKIINLNTITAGTHFFDGIDMFSTPIPPIPPVPPTPNILSSNLLYQIPQITFSYLYGLSEAETEVDMQPSLSNFNILELLSDLDTGKRKCVNLGMFTICSEKVIINKLDVEHLLNGTSFYNRTFSQEHVREQ